MRGWEADLGGGANGADDRALASTYEHLNEQPGSDQGKVSAIWIGVADGVLGLALRHVAASSGFRTVNVPASAEYRVSDRAESGSDCIDVLLVDPLPVPAAAALGALRSGQCRAIISTREPDMFPTAIRLLARSTSSISGSVLEEAALLPLLSRRQHRLLAFISAEGHHKDSVIARRLETSLTTLKRDLRSLGEMLRVSGRHELAATARALGYSNGVSENDLALLAPAE